MGSSEQVKVNLSSSAGFEPDKSCRKVLPFLFQLSASHLSRNTTFVMQIWIPIKNFYLVVTEKLVMILTISTHINREIAKLPESTDCFAPAIQMISWKF